jgi:hypothetical protein
LTETEGIVAKVEYNAGAILSIAPAGGQTAFTSTAPPTGGMYPFTLKYTAGSGYSFVVKGKASKVSWTLNKNGMVGDLRPIDYYNAIAVKVAAAEGDNATVTDLVFTAQGVSACGTLMEMDAAKPEQWVVATSSLTTSSWVLAGKVQLTSMERSADTKLMVSTYALPDQIITECADPVGRSAGCWDAGLWMKKDKVKPTISPA